MDEWDDDDCAEGELEAAAQVLHRLASVAVGLYAKAANISEPEAWRNVIELTELEAKPD